MLGLAAGCVFNTNGSEQLAIDRAQEEFAAVQALMAADIANATDAEIDDFATFAGDGGLRVDRSLLGLSDEEITQQTFGNGQRDSLLLNVSQEGDFGEVTLVTVAYAESGGGGSYNHTRVFACWTVAVDLQARTLGPTSNADCPAPVVDVIGPARELKIGDLKS